jgi:hypothetical protein
MALITEPSFCDHEKRHITARLKIGCALNKNTMSETKCNEILRGIGGYEACIPQISFNSF